MRDDEAEPKVLDGSWPSDLIKHFCLTSPQNRMFAESDEPVFEEPLVGYSCGSDPLYRQIKDDIGAPYMTPHEIFERSFPDIVTEGDDLTVICYVLPLARQVTVDNGLQTTYPAERWIRAKLARNHLAAGLAQHVKASLEDRGIESVSPSHAPFYTIGGSARLGLAATWSERHAAYVSGLGTFGLCDGLITERGKAVICGSFIARVVVPPTPRLYSDHHANCLHFSHGTCGLCISRCPAGAISERGHDKERCREYCFGAALDYVRTHFGVGEYGCGLCQTSVPCERRNPT